MSELELLKTEIEKYKQENKELRLKVGNVKNTISFRLGNILVMGVQDYKSFLQIPMSLYRLRRSVKDKRRKIKSNKNSEGLVFTQFDRFVIRDKLVESVLPIKSNEVFLKGFVYSNSDEKKNAGLLVFKVDGDSSEEISAFLGLKWSPKIGMYAYLPTGGNNEFLIQLKNLGQYSELNVGARRWYSKDIVKLSGRVDVKKSKYDEFEESGVLKKYLAIYDKKGVDKVLDLISKDKNESLENKNLILISLMLRLDVSERKDIENFLNLMNPCDIKNTSHFYEVLLEHLFKIGCYQECSTLLSAFKVKVNNLRHKSIQDALILLKKGVHVPALSNNQSFIKSNVVRYVLHCSLPHHSNGYATRSHSVLTALNEQKINVSAITRPGYPWDIRLSAEPSDENKYTINGSVYEHIGGPIQRECTISEYIDVSARAIEANIIKNGARLVHACSNYMTAYPALIAARRLGLPFVYEVRGFWEITEQSRKVGWEKSDKFQLDRKMETDLVRQADAVITLTEAMKTEISSRGVDCERVFVVPNAVDIEKFIPTDRDELLAKEIGLKNKVTIGYVGSIVDYEGLDDLLKASKKLLDGGFEFNILIVGDGAALVELKETSKELGISGSVIFTGRVPHEDVGRYYSLIDIAPFPRKSLEVCELVSPLKPFEAMALKKTVIASNVNAIQEFIAHGENGLLFEKGSIDSLVQTLKTVLSDDELRNNLSKTGYEWVKENRNWSYATSNVNKVYELAEKNITLNESETIHNLKEIASYYLSNQKQVQLTDLPSIDCAVDSKANYIVSGEHDAKSQKSGVVIFGFTPKLNKTDCINLGFNWSDKYGAFRYLPLQKGKSFEIPFKTGASTVAVSIKFIPWNDSSVKINNKIQLRKSFNGLVQAKKTLVDNNNKKKIALYGDVNTNLIDGASIWLISLAKTLSKISNIEVYIFLKDVIRDSEVIDDAYQYENIYLIEPARGPMKPPAVVDSIKQIESNYGIFDAVIVRGSAVCHALSNSGILDGRLIPYLTDIPQSTELLTDDWIATINDIVYSSRNVLCQTKELQAFFSENFPKAVTSLLPPMVPSFIPVNDNRAKNVSPIIVYAGKFAPEWGIRELFSVFRTLQKKMPALELHVYGDKIHNPKEDPSFYAETLSHLKSGDGIIWHGRAPRQKVLNALGSASLAWAWRHASLEDNTKELSTKLLEYGLAKVPVILNGSPLYRDILGEKYELFASNEEELVNRAIYALTRKKKATSKLTLPLENLVKLHSFEYVANNHLKIIVESLPRKQEKVILLAGHDLKFFTHLEAAFKAKGYRVLVDKWQGHNKHDQTRSRSLLKQADVVICEWCLGNAVWYSNNITESKALHIRVHGQENKLDYFTKINFEKVNTLNFVSQHLLNEVVEKHDCVPLDKCQVIPNYVLTEKLDRPKIEGAEFNIGLVGIVPEMKRLDKALDILEEVRKKDKRYTLYIKGKKPEDYPWMKNRPEEMAYYEEQYARINKSKLLKGAVIFDGFGPDMAEWYRKVGYVLSTSDYESFHLSVADCAASGGVPIVLDWPGAKELYGDLVCSSIEDSVKKVLSVERDMQVDFPGDYSVQHIVDEWISKV